MDPLNRSKKAISDYADPEVILGLVFARKKVVLLTMAATFGAALVGSLVSPARYESTAKILAEPRKEDNPYQIELRSQQERKAFLETQKEIVGSRSVLVKTLAKQQKKDEKSVSEQEVEQLASRVSVRSRSQLGRMTLSGSGVGESNIFFVTVAGSSAQEAADTANTLVQSYLEVASRVKADQAGSAVMSLQSSVTASTERTKKAHEALAQFEATTGPLLAELVNIDKENVRVFPELQSLRESFESEKAKIAMLKHEIGSLRSTVEGDGEPEVPMDILAANSTISFLRGKTAELKVRMNELLPFYNEDSRDLVAIREQLDTMNAAIRGELRLNLESMTKKLAAMEAAQAERTTSLNDYEKKLAELSKSNSRYAELKREYAGNAKALDTQIEALAAATIASAKDAGGAANISVVDPAIPNLDPVSPRTLLNCIISVPLGLILGLVAVFLGQFLRPVFIHPRQLEKLTGLDVISSIPNLPGGSR